MEGFVAVRDICSFREIRALSRRSDVKGLVQLASHLGAIAAAAVVVWLAAGTWWLLVPAELVLGVLLTFLFCPLHETIHRTAFRSTWLNDAVAWLTGFVVFLPSTWFRYFHFEHHRFTHIEGADPELEEPKPATRLSFLFYLSGLKSFWWSSCKTLVRHACGRVTDRFVPDDAARRACIVQARLYLAGYAAILAAAVWAADPAPLLYWIIPLALSAWSLRLYLMAEHTLLPFDANMLENTRTMRTNAAVRWLAWQMPYHTEHHVFPSVPFHALHEAFDRIAPRHGHVIPGYLAFAGQYWASLASPPPEERSGIGTSQEGGR